MTCILCVHGGSWRSLRYLKKTPTFSNFHILKLAHCNVVLCVRCAPHKALQQFFSCHADEGGISNSFMYCKFSNSIRCWQKSFPLSRHPLGRRVTIFLLSCRRRRHLKLHYCFSFSTFCLDAKSGAKKSRTNECLRPFVLAHAQVTPKFVSVTPWS